MTAFERQDREAARARVAAFVAAITNAHFEADARLIDALTSETDLARQGVTYALEHALEKHVSLGEIDAMVDRARSSPFVGLVLASNVFHASFRAIAWGLAQAPLVSVRPSRRCRTFPHALLTAIESTSVATAIEVIDTDDPIAAIEAILLKLPRNGALHAYGGRATIASIANAAASRADVHLELHGPGIGVILASAKAIAMHADSIARDVALFDQRGCLSPRLAIAVGTNAEAAAACDALHVAFERIDLEVPRGALDLSEASSIRLACEAAAMAGRAHVGAGHAILDLADAEAVALAVTARVLPVYTAASLDAAIDRLHSISATVTCIGTDESDTIRARFPGARVASLGEMQRPAFDGPVDLRPLVRGG